MQRSLKVTTHAAGFDHLVQRGNAALLDHAQNGLHQQQPQHSAKRVISIRQAIILVLIAEALITL